MFNNNFEQNSRPNNMYPPCFDPCKANNSINAWNSGNSNWDHGNNNCQYYNDNKSVNKYQRYNCFWGFFRGFFWLNNYNNCGKSGNYFGNDSVGDYNNNDRRC